MSVTQMSTFLSHFALYRSTSSKHIFNVDCKRALHSAAGALTIVIVYLEHVCSVTIPTSIPVQ